MEKLIINHQRNRFKGKNIKKIKEDLYKKYPDKDKISIHSLELDHIIPFCVSLDNSMNNLQLLTKKEHQEKSIIDRKIVKILKKKGHIEKISGYSHELMVSIDELKKYFTQELVHLSNLDFKITHSSPYGVETHITCPSCIPVYQPKSTSISYGKGG